MTTLLMKRATVVVPSVGGPGAQAVAVLPDSSQFLGFAIVITGFNLGKEFEIQGSINGTDFFTLDSTTAFLPTPHAISSAIPVMLQLELYTPLPGGLRVVSTMTNLTTAGAVQVMMYNTAFNPGRS